jgi:opacity protein-like surface antigen
MKKIYSVLIVLFLFTGLINAQGKIALGFNGGAAIPTGDFGDDFDMGWGGNALFIYHISPNADFTGSVGYITWSGKDSIDATYSSIPVLIGVRYLFGKEKIFGYGSAELGAHFTTLDLPEIDLGEGEVFGGSESNTYFGWALGAGLLYKINEKLDLDFSAKYNMILVGEEDSWNAESTSIDYISLMLGLEFGLN